MRAFILKNYMQMDLDSHQSPLSIHRAMVLQLQFSWQNFTASRSSTLSPGTEFLYCHPQSKTMATLNNSRF